MRSILFAALTTVLRLGSPALAQDDEDDLDDEDTASSEEADLYMDDRSTPEAVIESYYNAINRVEYARAFSYYGEAAEPDSYDEWETGYSDTFRVDLNFGNTEMDGAAGSTYYHVPVKLTAETSDGGFRYFAGCYVIRLANPSIQGVPFEPMHIESASLKKANKAAKPPKSCN
jgi:hypothetical protein